MLAELVYFKAYGFLFASELPLPGLTDHSANEVAAPDVYIIERPVSCSGITNPKEQGVFFQAKEHELWLHVPGVAYFLIQNGQHILIDRDPNAAKEAVYPFLAGPCIAALLMQRNLLVLSGAVVQRDGVATAYLGESCSGKSSLAAAMAQMGYQIMADNLCVINEHGVVFPGPPLLELWTNSIASFNVAVEKEQLIKPGLVKYRIPLQNTYCAVPRPLETIYVLNPRKKNELEEKILVGSEKMKWLQKNIANKYYVSGFNCNLVYFKLIAELAKRVSVTLLQFNGIHLDVRQIALSVAGA